MMERLYTPWRYDYVSGDVNESGCVFCNRLECDERENYVLHRSRHWYVVLNLYPYNTGHVLLVLNRHAGSLSECTAAEVADMGALIQAVENALRETYRPDGINCGYNGGSSAGAGIPDHFHVHLVPRWLGDTNFMTVIGDTRVMPQSLDQCWDALRPVLAAQLVESGL